MAYPYYQMPFQLGLLNEELEKITQEVENILVGLKGFIPYTVKSVDFPTYNKSKKLLTPTEVLPQIHIRIGGGAGDEEYRFKIDDWIEELHRVDEYLNSEGFTLSTLNYLHSDLDLAIKALSGREIIGITLYYKLKN